ncbi:hypothetical protein EGW08_008272 [Elysia chlorotica]|uniref:Uncharacterized protein n=1 Tax=Elysia chlorotica TaxID=188477 RepID=A0A433TR54_ELYCH|nr:hypothetical protein EGW08_008272 [Elysia chlorotica]
MQRPRYSFSFPLQIFHYDCPYKDIIKAQCRPVSAGTFPEQYPDGGIFSQTYWHDGRFLRVPCDRSGIVCVDSDQKWAHLQAGRTRDTEVVESNESTESTESTNSGPSWPMLSQDLTPDTEGTGSSESNSSEYSKDGWPSPCDDYEVRFLCDLTEDIKPQPCIYLEKTSAVSLLSVLLFSFFRMCLKYFTNMSSCIVGIMS